MTKWIIGLVVMVFDTEITNMFKDIDYKLRV